MRSQQGAGSLSRKPKATLAAMIVLTIVAALPWASQAELLRVPAAEATALDGRAVRLPGELPGHANVLILGFGRNSEEAMTAWEKPTRISLAHMPEVGFFDIATLAEVPRFLRGWVTRAIRNKVPDVLKPNFLILTSGEDAWKRIAGYDDKQPDAAYVVVVDRAGSVRWSTHDPYTPAHFALMAAQAKQLAGESR